MWKTILRPRSCVLTEFKIHASAYIEPITKPPDPVLEAIKCAKSPEVIFNEVQAHFSLINPEYSMQAMRSLFQLYKTKQYNLYTVSLMKNPAFLAICENIRKHARAMDIYDIVDTFKILTYLKIPVNSIMSQTLLQLIRCNINDLNVKQIMLLEFLLEKTDHKNYLVNAIKTALPLVFEIHLPLEVDYDDLNQLICLLEYCCAHKLPDKCLNIVITGILEYKLDVTNAHNIIFFLCNATIHTPNYVKLLKICLNIVMCSLNEFSYEHVSTMASKLGNQIKERHLEFYDKKLMDSIGNYVIDSGLEFEKALHIAKILTHIGHTHLPLLEYICKLAATDSKIISNTTDNILIDFINCLSINDFKPESKHWDEIQRQISMKTILINMQNTALPWPKWCLSLATLGYYDEILIKKIFNKQFLEEHISCNQKPLDYSQLLILQDAVTTFFNPELILPKDVVEQAKLACPVKKPSMNILKNHLEHAVGGSQFMAKNVIMPSGIVADALICLKSGHPVEIAFFKSYTKVPFEELNLPLNSSVVCIVILGKDLFSKNSKRLRGFSRLLLELLENKGYVVVPINYDEWLKAPEQIRTSYLISEISIRCEEKGIKICMETVSQ